MRPQELKNHSKNFRNHFPIQLKNKIFWATYVSIRINSLWSCFISGYWLLLLYKFSFSCNVIFKNSLHRRGLVNCFTVLREGASSVGDPPTETCDINVWFLSMRSEPALLLCVDMEGGLKMPMHHFNNAHNCGSLPDVMKVIVTAFLLNYSFDSALLIWATISLISNISIWS